MKMKERYLMAPEDDDFSSGGMNLDPNYVDDSSEGEGEGEGGDGEGSQGGNTSAFDVNTLSTAMANAIRTAMPSQQQPQQPQLTQAQLDQQMKKFVANEELASQLFNVDATPAQRAELLNKIINGVTEHALTVAGYMQKYSTDQLRGELTPIQQHLEELKLKDFTRGVTLEFPGLKGREQLIHAAISQINQMGVQPKSKKEAIKMVGNAVANYAKQIDPNFQLVPQQQQNRGKTASLMMGNSGGGARNSSQGKQNKPAWQSLFS